MRVFCYNFICVQLFCFGFVYDLYKFLFLCEMFTALFSVFVELFLKFDFLGSIQKHCKIKITKINLCVEYQLRKIIRPDQIVNFTKESFNIIVYYFL